ncbi:MAG TPA: hypothetical protein VIV60_27525 [Polyangiaceae bacterium]
MTKTACPCDDPPVQHLQIPAGQPQLARQTQHFPEVRQALLGAVAGQAPLEGWRARGERDFGLMWLEMWAYVADVLGFYDERIANESYIRTAVRRPSLRRIVGMLGYVPSPGSAGSAVVAAIAEGKTGVTVPKGTAIRSSAFTGPLPDAQGQPPQVFEVTADTAIHPAMNSWQIGPIAATASSGTSSTASYATPAADATTELTFETAGFGLAKDLLVLVREDPSQFGQVSTVANIKPFQGKDQKTYLRVTFAPAISLPSGVTLSDIEVLTPTIKAVAIEADIENVIGGTNPPEQVLPIRNDDEDSTRVTIVDLDTVYRQIRSGDPVIVKGPAIAPSDDPVAGEIYESANGLTAHRLLNLLETRIKIPTDAATKPTFPVTTLTLIPARGGDLGGGGFSYPQYSFHFGFVRGGRVTEVAETQPHTSVLQGDVPVLGVVEPPPSIDKSGSLPEQRYLLRDANDVGALVFGIMTFYADGTASFRVTQGEMPSMMRTPITVFGNILDVTRGESVYNEVLGSGNAQLTHQSFKLKKKPLTYLPDQSVEVTAVKSTLQIRVDQVLWDEVRTFYGRGAEERIYTIRTDDEQNTIVTFGDGINGSRLPSGVKNVVATYRYGAGVAAPPAGAIRQVARAVKGLRRIESPIKATEGQDPALSEQLRTAAPKSVLLFGHLVSAPDFEVMANQIGGVTRAVAEFLFIDSNKGAGIVVTYIGSCPPEEIVSTLQLRAEPGLAIKAVPAYGTHGAFNAQVEIDKHYDKEVVAQKVKEALSRGPLATKNAPIGKPLYRSVIFDVIQSIEGVVGIASASIWKGRQYGVPYDFGDSRVVAACVGANEYLDFGDGERVWVTGVVPTAPAPVQGVRV